MNILILITRGDTIGGAQVHVKDMAQALQEHGHTVKVLFGQEGAFSELLGNLNIPYEVIDSLVREINIVQDIKALNAIRKKIQEIAPDILAIHSSKTGILGRIAAKMTQIPVVFTAHGWAFTEGVSPTKRVLYKGIEKLGMYFSDKVITVSHYDKHLALKSTVGNNKKIVTIQNGIPDIKKNLFSKPSFSPPTLIMVARFQQPKDHKSVILALYLLKDLEWTLKLVGEDGGLEYSVKELVSELNMDARVEFLGKREDVDSLLSQAQIFVLSSFWEGLPLSILEAMRSGLPVVASNVGGVKEAVLDGETGFVVDDFTALVQSLKTLICSAKRREQMGTLGRERYVKEFTFDKMYASTYALYQSIIAR